MEDLPLCSHPAWPITYHPGLAAEVVDRVEGVDGRQPSVLQANDQAAVVFTQGHAVGMLADQDEVGLEGSAEREAPTAVSPHQVLMEHEGARPQPTETAGWGAG